MAITDKYQKIRDVMPETVGNDDKFGQDITGARNPVTQRTIAQDGEARAVDKKKSSVLKGVLAKMISKKSKK
jgi:hypothetical protein